MTNAKKKDEALTAEYVVIRKGTQVKGEDKEKGDVVRLTKRQAKSLVNKVALKSDLAAHAGGIKESDAAKALSGASQKIEELQAANKALTAQVAELEAALKAKG